jgi:tol-pal system protein YbgF
MWNRRLAAFFAFVIIVAPAVPAGAANKEHQQLAADIRVLQEQAQELQLLLGTIGDAIKAVTAKLDEQHAATQKAFADERLTVSNLAGDLRVVREKIDDNNVRIASLTQEIEQLRQMVQQQSPIPRLSPAEPPGATGAVPAEPGGPPPPPPAVAIGTSPQRLFDQAFSDYTSGQWDLAIIGFESYIRTFPKSDLADDAQLNIGNSYLNDAKYEQAVEAYDLLIRTYPNADTIPNAYYKKGLALASLKLPDRAREAFEFVIKNYPDSDAGRLAKQRLGQIPKPN